MQADWIISSHRPPGEWPNQGRIEIERFDLRYREQLPLVLRDVNCVIGAKEKVRVAWRCGRSSWVVSGNHIVECVASAKFMLIRLYLTLYFVYWISPWLKQSLMSLHSTDWYCGSHGSWQVNAHLSIVPNSGESWRTNHYWWCWYRYNWTPGSAITTHNHSTGEHDISAKLHGC